MPDGFPVKALAMRTKIQSYMGMKRIIVMGMKDRSEAAGMRKPDPMDLSIVIPCLVKKVDDCAVTIPYTKLVAHMGNRLSTALASSTSVMLHAFPSPFKQAGTSNALLRKLSQ